MRALLMQTALLLALGHLSLGQPHNWIRTNPGGGGAFTSVGAGPSGTILIGSDLSGAYRSTDGGQSWDVIGASRGLTNTHVSAVGFHPTNPDILFIGTEIGVFRSADGGDSVTYTLQSGFVSSIGVSRSDPSIVYATWHPQWNSAEGRVYRSDDGGLTWASRPQPAAGRRMLKVAVHPTDPNIVYLLSGNARFACGPADIYRTTDGGTSWQHLSAGLSEVLDIAIDPHNPSTVLATTMNADCDAQFYWTDTDGDLYRSTDGGDNWGAPIAARTGVLLMHPDDPGKIRLIDPREPYTWISTSGTWTSTDNGSSWSRTGEVQNWGTGYQSTTLRAYGSTFAGIVKTLGSDLSDPDNFFWVNGQWTYGSFDGGTVFNPMHTNEVSPGWWQSTGVDNINNFHIDISQADPNQIYISMPDMGLWRSIDGGMSWQSGNRADRTGAWDGFGGNSTGVVSDPDRPGVVWGVLKGRFNEEAFLMKSTEAGEVSSWIDSRAGLGTTTRVSGLSVDPNSPVANRTLFAAVSGSVYRSSDDGANWSEVKSDTRIWFTEVDANNPDLIYAGGGSGLWRSMDGGDVWEQVGLPEMSGTSGDFWVTAYQGVTDIEADPNVEGRVFVTAKGAGKGMYRSDNAGTDWEKILTHDYMRTVEVSLSDPNLVYAGSSRAFTSGGYRGESLGLLYSTDGGDTWQSDNQGMAYPFVNSIALSNEDQERVFLGSPGTGFQFADAWLTDDAFTLDIQISLQGAYDASSGLMRDDLRSGGHLPPVDPAFGLLEIDPALLATTGSGALVDWMWVELRSGDTVEWVGLGLLRADGRLVSEKGGPVVASGVEDGAYSVVVRHRNHLAVRSAVINMTQGSRVRYDFRTAPLADPASGLGQDPRIPVVKEANTSRQTSGDRP